MTTEGGAEANAGGKPTFVNLDTFTVNLAEESGDHYLQVGIVYQVADDKDARAAVQRLKQKVKT